MKKITSLIIVCLGFILNIYSQTKTHELWEYTEIGSLVVYFSLEEALKHPEKVRGLQIRDKGLEKIPEDIAKLINLEYLRIHHNRIESIPNFIFKMKTLRVLEIGGNKLGVIPEEIGEMKQLEHLGLKANGLTSLPESIGDLINLKSLDLNFNYFESLPESIKNLTKLEELLLLRNDTFTRAEKAKISKLLPNCSVR